MKTRLGAFFQVTRQRPCCSPPPVRLGNRTADAVHGGPAVSRLQVDSGQTEAEQSLLGDGHLRRVGAGAGWSGARDGMAGGPEGQRCEGSKRKREEVVAERRTSGLI